MALSCTQMNSKGSGAFRTYVSALKNPDQRFKGRSFFFAETGWEYFREKWFEVVSDHSYGLRIGMGISRKYKDFGVFISHGFELELEENDGNRSWDAGLMRYPRVVA